MNNEPDQPLPERTACPEGNLAAAQHRIRQLEDKLCEAEQELKAANEIIEELDWKIEELKLELEGADMMLEEGAEACRKLERRLAQAQDARTDELDDPCPVIVPVPIAQTPQQPGYPPGYKPNPIVEAMVAQFEARKNQ